jgi:hypothetical protein
VFVVLPKTKIQTGVLVFVLIEQDSPKEVSALDALNANSSMVELQLVAESEGNAAPETNKAGPKILSVTAAELLSKCTKAGGKWEQVTMEMVKSAMESLHVAPSLELWTAPQSKLLDYSLPFTTYFSQLWATSKEDAGKLTVYYGRRKNCDQRTAKQVYDSMNFLLKVYHIKSDETGTKNPVASMMVKNLSATEREEGVLKWDDVAKSTLGTFRKKINTMWVPSIMVFCPRILC